MNIGEYLKNYEIKSRTSADIRSERAEMVQKFTDRINEGRTGTKYKPLTPRAVAIKLSHIPTGDLHAFYQQCEQAKCFSAYFFWAIKAQ